MLIITVIFSCNKVCGVYLMSYIVIESRGDRVKNNLLKKIFGLGVLLSVIAIPVKADSGFAIGVSGNVADFTTSGTEEEGYGAATSPQGIESTAGSAANSVEFGAIFAEFAGRNNWAGMTIGLEYIPGKASLGSASRTDVASTTEDGATSDDSGTYTGKAEVSEHCTLYIEPTFYATEGIGIYAKGGLSNVKVTSLESISKGINSSAYGDVRIWGATLGAGLRFKHSSGFLIKTEYSHTEYEGITLTSTTGNQNRIKADPESDNIRVAIGWQF